jgi:resolvase-like protein
MFTGPCELTGPAVVEQRRCAYQRIYVTETIMREVVPAFRVKMVRFSGGERFPVLLDRAGMPLGEPVPYLWRRRSEGRAVNTLESNAQALAMVHDFLLANDIDFRLRVPEGLRKRTFSAYARSATAGDGARLRTEDEEYSRQHLGKGPDFLFLDAGKSGLTIDRSGFLGLIRVVQSGNIGAVVATDTANLSRDGVQLWRFRELLHMKRVVLHLVCHGSIIVLRAFSRIIARSIPFRKPSGRSAARAYR